MARHRKLELLDTIVQSINECGWNVLYASDTSAHPFCLRIYRDHEGYLLRVYIWHLTHGGGVKRPTDEYRIQITGIERFARQPDEKTLILGWWAPVGVFAAFDYNKHARGLGLSPSIQIKEESLRKAHENGVAVCDKGNNKIAVAFRPDFFVEYVRNIEQLHTFGNIRRDFEILEEVVDKRLEVNEALITQVSKPRRTAVLTISKRLRDNSFKSRVLAVYTHKCAMCGIQLRLVDAAHILPVTHEHSTDETSNGVAMCALHHRAYDLSLITFDDKYRVQHNRDTMRHLLEIGYDGGMDKFIKELHPLINVPPAIGDRPNRQYVVEANTLRGWKLIS